MQTLTLNRHKIAAAQAQANKIRTDLAQPIVLDYAKIAALQQWSLELQSRFEISRKYATVQR